tara:strand:+ start:4521 stop:5300 length:780 start_codon:yes stop_codon:yes gene_type:complete
MTDNIRTLQDPMDVARAQALQATLDLPPIALGDPLPPFAHHIYFWDVAPLADLGRDGHPAKGLFIPDMDLPRRMWAAGHLIFHRPLLAGIRAEKTSQIESVTRKTGRSGPLAFVRIRHDIRQRQTLALTETQDLVFREDQVQSPAPPIAAADEDHATQVHFNSTLLFRYSALTFNGHRIHYDEAYARHVEGYDGLVVHGPLLAHLLMNMAQQHLGSLTTFSYRATAPLMHSEVATLCWKDGRAWVRGPDGRQCMTATAT